MKRSVLRLAQGCLASRPLGKARLHTTSSISMSPAGADRSQRREAAAANTNMAYVSYENPQYAQSQTPLVIQHGLFGRKENFKNLGKQFHHLTRRDVIIPDIRIEGLEESPPSTPVELRNRYSEMSTDLINLIGQLELDKVCMLGHATGGRVAMYIALTRPELLDRLVVVSSSPLNTVGSMERWQRNREACFLLAEMLHKHGITNTAKLDASNGGVEFKLDADQALKTVLTDSSERALFLSNLGKVDLKALLHCSNHLGTFPSMQDNSFEGPALFITGERQPAWQDDREVRCIRQLFPNSHFVKVPGASHWVHTEASKEFLAATASFLQTQF